MVLKNGLKLFIEADSANMKKNQKKNVMLLLNWNVERGILNQTNKKIIGLQNVLMIHILYYVYCGLSGVRCG